jgi:aminopeptidase
MSGEWGAVVDVTIRRYAGVLLDVGLQVTRGQRLFVHAPTHAEALVHEIAVHAYRAGARNVDVLWTDPALDRARLLDGSDDAVAEVSYHAEVLSRAERHEDVHLRLFGDDALDQHPPVDDDRARLQAAAFQQARSRSSSITDFKRPWTLAAVPGPVWAGRVFPDLAPADAMGRLWDAVIRACRADEPDPVAAWRQHLARLDAICAHLQQQRYDRLRFVGPGTDLSVGLARAHAWAHPGTAPWGVANIPTEEAPTAPDAQRTQGTARIRRPAVIDGTLVRDAHLTFVDGAVVAATATTGQQALDELLATPGGDRLGEVALVPQSSRVAREGLVWHNTLFDENDASHIALGNVIPPCIHDGLAMSPEQLEAAGANLSPRHVDLVIGSNDVSTYGITANGTQDPLILNGEWAIPI